ncbi:Uncharacterized protein OBRU01_10318, partial [Operophtera brumata]
MAHAAKGGDDPTNIKRLKMNIGQFKGRMSRAAKFANEQEQQVLFDPEGLRIRMEELYTGLQNYKECILDLMLATGDEEYEDGEIEERYFEVMARLKSVLKKAEASTPSEDCREPVVARQHNKLPQLDIPSFDGKDITEYTAFINIFRAVVDKEESLKPVQKLFYLRKYLKCDPLLLIDGLPLVSESYVQALDLLEKRYDNKCLLITHHVNALLDYQPISKGTPSELRHLVSIARQHLGALKGLGEQTRYWDRLVIPILLRKLDVFSCREYHADRDTSKLPSLEEFLNYMEKRAMSFEESQISTGKSPSNKHFSMNKSVNLVNARDNKVNTCKYCNAPGHKIFSCKEFQVLSAQDRVNFVTKEKLCKICLNIHTKKCNFHFKCSLCKSKEHNSLLHLEDSVCNFAKSAHKVVSKDMVLLPTIMVKFRATNGSFVTARGLVDSGSQVSFIKDNLIQHLNVSTFNYNVNVTALGQKQKTVAKAVNLSMHSMHNNYSCNALFSVVDNITSYLPQTKFDVSDIEIPENVVLADSEFNKPGEISFLISADIFFNIILPDKINLARHKLFLLATKYGYIVSGNIEKGNVCLSSQNISSESVILHATVNEDKVDSLIQKFWEEQHTPEIKHENTNDRLDICETSFQNSVQLKNKRFQVSLPLKVPIEEIKLGDSFNVALQRLNVLCKKFTKNHDLKVRYTDFINHDSQVALCWLLNPPTKDNYVRNRVVSVNEQTKDCMWSHVSGSCNPADCLSRGLLPSEIHEMDLWWHGPPDLQNDNFSAKPF